MERAKDLLAHANLTVAEVCMVVGFASVGSFTRRFRELVGCTPGEYRRQVAPPPIPGCIVLMWSRPRPAAGDSAIAEKTATGRDA